MMNPYWGKNFFGFFGVLFSRLAQWLRGDLPLDQLASDEIQLLVLTGVALSSALVGTFLVLKRMTMLANSLSHTILFGIVLAYLITLPFTSNGAFTLNLPILLFASLLTALLTTFLTQFLTQFLKLQEDASIGLVFTTLFALGVVLITLYTRNTHLGTEVVMGNVDALHFDDLKLISIVFLSNLAITGLFYKEFKVTAFDSMLANSLGIRTSFFHTLLMVQTAATAIGAFRAVGVLLMLAFLVGPVISARLLTHNLPRLILLAMGLGVLCSVVGVALSRHILSVHHVPLSTAGLVVSLISLAFVLAILLRARARAPARARNVMDN
jgi:manganese/zinc/iron transport system permease protein